MNAVKIRMYYEEKCKKCRFFVKRKNGYACYGDVGYTWELTYLTDATFFLDGFLKLCDIANFNQRRLNEISNLRR